MKRVKSQLTRNLIVTVLLLSLMQLFCVCMLHAEVVQMEREEVIQRSKLIFVGSVTGAK